MLEIPLYSNMQHVALFKFENKFHITGRGLVIAGQIIECSITTGNFIYFDERNSIKILGVEYGHTSENQFIGLLISVPIKEDELKFEQLIVQTLTIIP